MSRYYTILSLHLLGAMIWAGGHVVLAVAILPDALRRQSAAPVQAFEARYERIGMTALAVQVLTGLWLVHNLLGGAGNWFGGEAIAHVVQVKLALLAATLALAVHARVRVIPRLTDQTLPVLAWHIRAVTTAAVLLVLAGASVRFGGYPVFDR